MKVSIVDMSPVLAGSTAIEALRTTMELAELADHAGFSRYWLGELHGLPTHGGTSPEVAIAAVASKTKHLRVGSGAVLMNHRSPYRVAETFVQLHAMFPGRIDLGLGRATSGPLIDLALQQSRAVVLAEQRYEGKLVEVLQWFDGFHDEHRFAQIPFFQNVPGRPEPWILGSTPASAVIAANLGVAYCFAAFLNPAAARTSLATYRRKFRPSLFHAGLDRPYSMLAVNAVCGETERQALRVQAAGELVRRLAATGRYPNGVPSAADALEQLGGPPEPTRYAPGSWPHSVAAAPGRLRDVLDAMVVEVGADELMIHDLIATPSDRLTSYHLIADAFELRASARPGAPARAGLVPGDDRHAA